MMIMLSFNSSVSASKITAVRSSSKVTIDSSLCYHSKTKASFSLQSLRILQFPIRSDMFDPNPRFPAAKKNPHETTRRVSNRRAIHPSVARLTLGKFITEHDDQATRGVFKVAPPHEEKKRKSWSCTEFYIACGLATARRFWVLAGARFYNGEMLDEGVNYQGS